MGSAIERDPAYPTWEAERVALSTRRAELSDRLPALSLAEADAAYQDALTEGFDESHAQERADAIVAEADSLRSEMRKIDLRLSIIKPHVQVERLKMNREADKGQYQERLLGSLERIADALESMSHLIGRCDTSSRVRKPKDQVA